MTHLTAAELIRWRDQGRADERERVLSHLASCDACRAALVDLVRLQAPVGDSTPFDARDFVSSGRAAYSGANPNAARWTWRSAVAVSGIAAGLLLAALVLPSLFRTARGTESIQAETRGGDVRLIEPHGEMGAPFSFRWSSPVAASSYRVTVYDAAQRVVYTSSSRAEELALPDAIRAQLVAGAEYVWTVDALDAADTKIIGSGRQTFTVAAR